MYIQIRTHAYIDSRTCVYMYVYMYADLTEQKTTGQGWRILGECEDKGAESIPYNVYIYACTYVSKHVNADVCMYIRAHMYIHVCMLVCYMDLSSVTRTLFGQISMHIYTCY